MMIKYDVISVGGYQFLVESKETLYDGMYEILKVHEKYEAMCLDAVKCTNVQLSNADVLIQGIASECVALIVADSLEVVEITYLG